MNEEQLRGWMRVLPQTKASPAFTSDVMRRIRQERCARRDWRPVTWRASAALAMAACLAVLVHGAITVHAQRQRADALRAEHQQLEVELERVKKIASDADPVVVLEDGRGTRVIIDFDEDRHSAIQPASYTNFD